MRDFGRLDTLVWALLFGGLLLLGPGIALRRAGQAWGWLVIAVGVGAAVAGIVLVWVRSRLPDPPAG